MQMTEEMIVILNGSPKKRDISQAIKMSVLEEESIRGHSRWLMGSEVKHQIRGNKKYRDVGNMRFIESACGQVWLLPSEALKDFACRKEQRRRKQIEMWEAPTPRTHGDRNV